MVSLRHLFKITSNKIWILSSGQLLEMTGQKATYTVIVLIRTLERATETEEAQHLLEVESILSDQRMKLVATTQG